ncbi:DUF4166 domain-containing protein [Ovoidimarina sediminis]|uniref:DUF4166 domain-containing protein n=1 Tax=Ovoidimarina sediminis TaxID=3079856 RepID=UPI00290F1A02|nr:DUF4166 domain-containing protein [Rhodophyticola sp. MJ-SS7]MDU8945098.1 DUF4166 domain-containing protein [Rhodophyticola sp. MJ-SS7]
MKILVLGGYGVFGGRAARFLAAAGHDVIVAGRSPEKAAARAAEIGGSPLALDGRDAGALDAALRAQAPDILIDAAGPFQGYGDHPYATVEAALRHKAHYLDLSDDAGFTAGITAHDEAARAASRTVLSGLSSVPALSAAAARWGAGGLSEITLISSAILPGNRAPRGLSVVAAILAQAGRPLREWRGGAWVETPAWCRSQTVDLGAGIRRPAAPIGAPDLALFPGLFAARSVRFRAGLELGILHYGVQAVAWATRLGLLRYPERHARLFTRLAALFEPFGTDRGGMLVAVSGRDAAGRPLTRTWTLIAEEGDGPNIPAIPAEIAVTRIARGDVAPGARPATEAFDLDMAEAALSRFAITCRRAEEASPRLIEAALAEDWAALPPEIRRIHDIWDRERFEGRATVTRGTSFPARLLARLMGFPPALNDTPVSVTMERKGAAEIWTRRFGCHSFQSTLSPETPGVIRERFGPLTALTRLTATPKGLAITIERMEFLGIPLPAALNPVSDVTETVESGRFTFDIRLALPWGAPLVHYKGWLAPA